MGATPMLWALGMLPVLGLGLAASVVSAIDASRDTHLNYWQTGQQHALFFGAATIGAVAAISSSPNGVTSTCPCPNPFSARWMTVSAFGTRPVSVVAPVITKSRPMP